ncbi:lysophospholipid acyltransferase family protein [Nocardioides sp. WS12]|uniref:lysophospholipid acyltransferase family protein n=1 Tax=Nocardioides sp. WS12 TaxID=2486272 RepID=UPI00191D81F0|nr:lysophospholipid acyltransferase family protein [Nocardioides sp. WS12]
MASSSDSSVGKSRLLKAPLADLSGRDPAFIRRMLPRLWLVASVWFRADVEGFEKVPDEPVLFVGNHSGGAGVPDTFVFLLGYNTYMTVEGRPLFALGHEMVTSLPGIGAFARKFGVVTATPRAAADVFAQDGSVLVYPGGDVEALRPWRDRHKIVFDGRKGFLRLAHENGVKIVPVVATGGQDTFFVLNDGRKTAKLLRFDKLLRVKTLPISFSIPWGFLPGDLPHIPLPAKIRIQVLDPIDLTERFGEEPDWDEAYDYVTSVMQAGLSTLAAKTVLPVLG